MNKSLSALITAIICIGFGQRMYSDCGDLLKVVLFVLLVDILGEYANIIFNNTSFCHPIEIGHLSNMFLNLSIFIWPLIPVGWLGKAFKGSNAENGHSFCIITPIRACVTFGWCPFIYYIKVKVSSINVTPKCDGVTFDKDIHMDRQMDKVNCHPTLATIF